MSKYEINLNKRNTIPKEIKIVKFNHKILVIAPTSANWMVFLGV